MISLTTPLIVSLVLSGCGVVIGFIGLLVAVNRRMANTAILIGLGLLFFSASLMIRLSHYFPWFHALVNGGTIVFPE